MPSNLQPTSDARPPTTELGNSTSDLRPLKSALRPSISDIFKSWSPIALFSILWLDLIRLLSGNWEAREQYAYGWFVPFFAAALLWRRWQDRPLSAGQSGSDPSPQLAAPPGLGPPTSDLRPPPCTQPSTPTVTPASHSQLSTFNFQLSRSNPLLYAQWGVVIVLALALLPLRVIFEINTDWPLIAWLYTGIVVLLTLYGFHLADPVRLSCGQWSIVRSPWTRHFFFPVAFIIVALVWPYRIEQTLTQNLMQIVATITVEILGWLNIPALQRGNLIEISCGVLGVDEACSGIRSLQSTLMAGLLMGELYRLKIWARAGLLVAGLGLAFCFNVVRTFLLSYEANKSGMSAIDKWHDPAGFTIAIACFFCLWAIAVLASKWFSTSTSTDGDLRSPTSDLRPPTNPQPSLGSGSAFNPQTNVYLLCLGLWSVLGLAATEVWYRSHRMPNEGVFHWSVSMPTNQPGFKPIVLPPRTLQLLAFDHGVSAEWTGDLGKHWYVHFFRWDPRAVESVITSRIHRPERCLPASGLKLVSESELEVLEANDLKLPFRKYVFKSETETFFVFFCQWEDGSEDQSGMAASNQLGRIDSVLKGRRKVGQQTLELILTGYNSLEEAEHAVRTQIGKLIDRERPNAVGKV